MPDTGHLGAWAPQRGAGCRPILEGPAFWWGNGKDTVRCTCRPQQVPQRSRGLRSHSTLWAKVSLVMWLFTRLLEDEQQILKHLKEVDGVEWEGHSRSGMHMSSRHGSKVLRVSGSHEHFFVGGTASPWQRGPRTGGLWQEAQTSPGRKISWGTLKKSEIPRSYPVILIPQAGPWNLSFETNFLGDYDPRSQMRRPWHLTKYILNTRNVFAKTTKPQRFSSRTHRTLATQAPWLRHISQQSGSRWWSKSSSFLPPALGHTQQPQQVWGGGGEPYFSLLTLPSP